MPLTLFSYILKKNLIYLSAVLLLLSSVIFLFDFIELLRISSSSNLKISLVFKLALMKNYAGLAKTLPFTFIISTLLTYINLTKSFELVVARSSGMSVWQFIAPSLLVALGFGLLLILVFNPLGAAMLKQYEKIEAIHLKGHESLLSVSSNGLWLRDYNKSEGKIRIIHALRLSQESKEFFEVTVFVLDANYRFIERIDADRMQLNDKKQWNLFSAIVTDIKYKQTSVEEMHINTKIAFLQIQESLVSPETISIYHLPSFINATQASGLSTIKHTNYFYKILLSPFLYASMVLISINFATSLPRSGKIGLSLFSGLMFGFLLYFISDIINAVGLSGRIPIFIAAASPTIICLSIGGYLTLHYEDG